MKQFYLSKGSHKTSADGMCAMEAVAFLAGEKHTDAPQCACPVIARYVIGLNDKLNDDERQLLKPYLKRIIGTRDGKSVERAKILAMAAVTKITPHAIEINFPEHARAMRAATDLPSAKKAAYAAAYAAYAAADAAYAAAYAAYAAAYAAYAVRKNIVEEALLALDEVLNLRDTPYQKD